MTAAVSAEPTSLSRWTSRLAIFAVVLVATAYILHRLFGMPTPTAVHLVGLAYVCAAAALLLALLAGAQIWMRGGEGTARIVAGLVISLALYATPVALLVLAREHPPINDVTTDVAAPPEFEALAARRGGALANSAAYPGQSFAQIQSRAFPDLGPLRIARPAAETFELVTAAVNRQRMEIVRSEPPGEGDRPQGMLEAVDRTLVAGFYDDVAIRVAGEEGRTRVDIRSASRYGTYDYGRNAERVRTLMREILARVDATVPAAEDEPPKDGKKAKSVKPDKAGDPKSEGRRKSRDRDR